MPSSLTVGSLATPLFIPSPHCDARPSGVNINLIVLHAISLPSGEFSMPHVQALFTGSLNAQAHPSFEALRNLRVTAHFVVERSGKINQFVPVAERAWHAGVSSWQGVTRCNDYSLGIEMIGDELSPFTVAQYRETARLCRALMLHFPDISRQRIIGHCDVAPGRKWDPGVQWSWAHFHRSLGHIRNVGMTFR